LAKGAGVPAKKVNHKADNTLIHSLSKKMSIKVYGGYKKIQVGENSCLVPFYSDDKNDSTFVSEARVDCITMTPVQRIVYLCAAKTVEQYATRATGCSKVFDHTALFCDIRESLQTLAELIIEAGPSPSGKYYTRRSSCSYLTGNQTPEECRYFKDCPALRCYANYTVAFSGLYNDLAEAGLIPEPAPTGLPEGIVYFNSKLAIGGCCRITIRDNERAHVRHLSNTDNHSYETEYSFEDGKLVISAPQPPMKHFEFDVNSDGTTDSGSPWKSVVKVTVATEEAVAEEPAQEPDKAQEAIESAQQSVESSKATVEEAKASIESAQASVAASQQTVQAANESIKAATKKTPEQARKDLCAVLEVHENTKDGPLMMKTWAYVRDNKLTVGGLRFKPDQKIRDAVQCTEDELTVADLPKYIK